MEDVLKLIPKLQPNNFEYPIPVWHSVNLVFLGRGRPSVLGFLTSFFSTGAGFGKPQSTHQKTVDSGAYPKITRKHVNISNLLEC